MSPLFESESSLRQQYNKMILEEKRAPEDLCRILGYCDRPQCRLWDASNFNTDEISTSSKVIKVNFNFNFIHFILKILSLRIEKIK